MKSYEAVYLVLPSAMRIDRPFGQMWELYAQFCPTSVMTHAEHLMGLFSAFYLLNVV